MKYLSVCSGIESATVTCTKCGRDCKPSEMTKQARRPSGLHPWCKACMCAKKKFRNETPESRREWNIATRYGLTLADVDAMRDIQGGVCGICSQGMKRECIDHCHDTGKVRGLLCHRCNVVLHRLENAEYRAKAMAYLERTK